MITKDLLFKLGDLAEDTGQFLYLNIDGTVVTEFDPELCAFMATPEGEVLPRPAQEAR